MGKKGGGTETTSKNPAWLDQAGQELYNFAKNSIFMPAPAAAASGTANPATAGTTNTTPKSTLKQFDPSVFGMAPASSTSSNNMTASTVTPNGPMTLENLRPLQQYTGDRVASLDPNMTLAGNIAAYSAKDIGGWFPMAKQNLTDSTRGFGQTLTSTPISTSMWNKDAMENYMSPFMDEVVANSIKDAQRTSDVERNRIKSSSAMSGAFGGSRHGLEESELARNTIDRVGNLSATGRQSAYDSALTAFMQDQARKLTADTSSEDFRMKAYESNRNQFNTERDRNLAAASTAGNLATARSNTISQAIERLLKTGSINMDNEQAKLDTKYGDFVEARDYPYTQMQRLMSIINGSPSQNSLTTVQKPNSLAQIAGGALSLASMIPTGGASAAFNPVAAANGLPWSDMRLKENIEVVGYHGDIPIVEFNYKGGKKRIRGVLAQDVREINPDAVVADEEGFMRVNYDMLGITPEILHV